MKNKIIIAALLLAAIAMQAQTNFISVTNQIDATNWVILEYKLVVVTNQHRAANNFRRFGDQIYDTKSLYWISGKIRAVSNGIVTVDIYKTTSHGGHPDVTERESIGAAGGGGWVGGSTTKELDKSIAVTNFPDFKSATINQEIRIIPALKVGNYNSEDGPIEFYDCGMPWIYQVVSTNKTLIRRIAENSLN